MGAQQWVEVHSVFDQDFQIVVSRQSGLGDKRARYSIAIWRRVGDKLYRNFVSAIAGQGELSIGRSAQQIAVLVSAAEDWILSAAQEEEDQRIEEQIDRERSRAGVPPAARPGIHALGRRGPGLALEAAVAALEKVAKGITR